MKTKHTPSYDDIDLFNDGTERTLTPNFVISYFQSLLNEVWHYNPVNRHVTICTKLPFDYVVGRIDRKLEEIEGKKDYIRSSLSVMNSIESGNLLYDENILLTLNM